MAKPSPGFLRRGASAPAPRLAGQRASPSAAGLPEGSSAEGTRRRVVESRIARPGAGRAGNAALQSRLCAAGGNHGPVAVGVGGVQLPASRCAEHDRAAELRERRTKAPLAASSTQRGDPFGLWHDRAGRGVVGCHQHRNHDYPARRRLYRHRPQMVHHRCRASAMQLPDRTRRHRRTCPSHAASQLRGGADECRRGSSRSSIALDGLRGSCRADR